MQQIRRRLTYANVMSSIAVFLVVAGGTAFAATQLPKNSVGTKQLKKNAVTTAKLKKNAVTTAKIKKNAVNTAKIKKNAVNTAQIKNAAITAAKIKAGAVGAAQIGENAVGATQIGANAVGNSQTQLVKVFKGSVVPAAAGTEESAPRVPLGSVGPFTFYGKCFHPSAGVVEERTYIELASGSATLGSEDGAEMPTSGNQQYLTPSTPEKEREMEGISAALNKANAQSNDEEFQATATDGTMITGLIGGTGAKSGSPEIGNGPFLAEDSCIVGAIAVFGS